MTRMNQYYKMNDGWFTYYINIHTGEKKFELDIEDELVESNLDDFYRKRDNNDCKW